MQNILVCFIELIHYIPLCFFSLFLGLGEIGRNKDYFAVDDGQTLVWTL